MPIKLMPMPMQPAIRPLISEPEDMLMMMVRPNKAKQANSGGPNLSANLASCGAMVMRAKKEAMPPKTDAQSAMSSAFRALPCLASS